MRNTNWFYIPAAFCLAVLLMAGTAFAAGNDDGVAGYTRLDYTGDGYEGFYISAGTLTGDLANSAYPEGNVCIVLQKADPEADIDWEQAGKISDYVWDDYAPRMGITMVKDQPGLRDNYFSRTFLTGDIEKTDDLVIIPTDTSVAEVEGFLGNKYF